MIIARVESFILGKGIEDALNRAFSYVKAGADGIMIHSKDKAGEDIKRFCKEFRLENENTPIVVVPSSYNHLYERDFIEWGANIVIYANHLLRASYPAMMKCAEIILKNKRSLETEKITLSIKEILNLIS